jgi:hypothetical protein
VSEYEREEGDGKIEAYKNQSDIFFMPAKGNLGKKHGIHQQVFQSRKKNTEHRTKKGRKREAGKEIIISGIFVFYFVNFVNSVLS